MEVEYALYQFYFPKGGPQNYALAYVG